MTITTEDPRTAKALAAIEHSGQWVKVRDASGRAIAYGIPSATTIGLYHFANSTQCTCPDHARFDHQPRFEITASIRLEPSTTHTSSL